MQYRFGDIWKHWPKEVVVVTTNIGWKQSGENVMGAGLAADAAKMIPELPLWYGSVCQSYGEDTPTIYHPKHRIVLFPTKALNAEFPHMSWKSNSDLGLIWRSTAQLAALCFDSVVAVPIVGCQNGGLSPEFVLPVMKKFLTHPRFFLVAKPSTAPFVEGIIGGSWGQHRVLDDPRPSSNPPHAPLGSYTVDNNGNLT